MRERENILCECVCIVRVCVCVRERENILCECV